MALGYGDSIDEFQSMVIRAKKRRPLAVAASEDDGCWSPDPSQYRIQASRSPPPPVSALFFPGQDRDDPSIRNFVATPPAQSCGIPLGCASVVKRRLPYGGDRRLTDVRDARRHQGGKEEDTEFPQGRSDGSRHPNHSAPALFDRCPGPFRDPDAMTPHDGRVGLRAAKNPCCGIDGDGPGHRASNTWGYHVLGEGRTLAIRKMSKRKIHHQCPRLSAPAHDPHGSNAWASPLNAQQRAHNKTSQEPRWRY